MADLRRKPPRRQSKTRKTLKQIRGKRLVSLKTSTKRPPLAPPPPFSPPSPQINRGPYTGKTIHDLSDDELQLFLTSSAVGQQVPRSETSSWSGLAMQCSDHSHYWAARFEIEQRKEATRPKPTSLEIHSDEDFRKVARHLLQYGFREATRKYHSDRNPGRPDIEEVHKLINLANEWVQNLMAKANSL
jgi:hypothetical protein